MPIVLLLYKKLSVLSKVQTSDPPLNFAKEGVGSVRGAVDGGAAEVGAIDCVELLV